MDWTFDLILSKQYNWAELNNLITELTKLESLKINTTETEKDYCVNIKAKNIHKIKESVLTNIAYFLVKEFKFYYFYKQLNKQKLPQNHIKSLSKALTIFDIENDIYLTLNALPKSGKVVAQSFYVFKMTKLKDKWQEFINVTNINSPLMANQEIYIEFLKFLYSAIPPQCDEVNVKNNLNTFSFTDKNNNELMPQVELNDELTLITNLIILAPSVINLHCIDAISNQTFKTLYYIFNKKLNLMV